MAIQIRRGSNAEWEVNNSNIVVGEPAVATDSKRAFIGTASGAYMELANIEAIAPAYDPGNSYMVDDYVSYQGKLYVCTVPTSGAWNASCWQVTSIGQALAENAYSNYETYTVSGDIASFPNGAGGIPVKDLKANIEAVQDLHGYDHPWVGGAGKNKLPNNASTTTTSGITFTKNSDGSVKVNGTATATVLYWFLGAPATTMILSSGNYTMTGCPSGGSASTYRLSAYDSSGNGYAHDYGNGVSFNSLDEGLKFAIVVFSGATVNNLTFYPMVRLSTTDATWQPYENICPISGWDEVNVVRTGKNLIDSDFLLEASGWTKDSNGVYSGNSKALWDIFKTGVPSYTLKGKQSITISFYAWNDSALRSIYVYLIYTDGTRETVQVETTTRTLFQIHSNPTKDISMLAISYSNQVITHIDSFQIEQGQVVTDYVPYNGQTYTPDLDGTRYGGTLDVTTGVLTLTHGYVDLGTLTWVSETSAVTGMFRTDGNQMPSVPLLGGNLICSQYKGVNKTGYAQLLNGEIAVTNIQSGSFLRIIDVSKTSMTATQFKTAMSGVQLAYQLYSTQTVQLSPTQMRTLLGQNNIWADSGEVEVTYRISNVQ